VGLKPHQNHLGIVTWNAELTLGSDYADPNRLALTFWILQANLLRLFLFLEGVNSPPTYLKRSHRSTILGMRVYSTGCSDQRNATLKSEDLN